jgi:hypothetical protein
MDNQINLFAPVSAPTGKCALNDPDEFGCCSRFRACSDARRCLISDSEYATHCAYRKNLESGRIFYGKNGAGFSSAQYAEILQRVDALSSAARKVFDALLIVFCEYNRGVRRTIARNVHIAELSAVGLFEFHPLGPEFTSRCAYRSYLLPEAKKSPDFANAQAAQSGEREALLNAIGFAEDSGNMAEVERLKEKLKRFPAENTKEFLLHWLDHDGVALRDRLSSPYCFACLHTDLFPYAEEFYRDTLLSGCESRIYPVSPLAEDRLLSISDFEEEELRRVKLSRGYSPEEKARRVSEIEQARAVRLSTRRNTESDDLSSAVTV